MGSYHRLLNRLHDRSALRDHLCTTGVAVRKFLLIGLVFLFCINANAQRFSVYYTINFHIGAGIENVGNNMRYWSENPVNRTRIQNVYLGTVENTFSKTYRVVYFNTNGGVWENFYVEGVSSGGDDWFSDFTTTATPGGSESHSLDVYLYGASPEPQTQNYNFNAKTFSNDSVQNLLVRLMYKDADGNWVQVDKVLVAGKKSILDDPVPYGFGEYELPAGVTEFRLEGTPVDFTNPTSSTTDQYGNYNGDVEGYNLVGSTSDSAIFEQGSITVTSIPGATDSAIKSSGVDNIPSTTNGTFNTAAEFAAGIRLARPDITDAVKEGIKDLQNSALTQDQLNEVMDAHNGGLTKDELRDVLEDTSMTASEITSYLDGQNGGYAGNDPTSFIGVTNSTSEINNVGKLPALFGNIVSGFETRIREVFTLELPAVGKKSTFSRTLPPLMGMHLPDLAIDLDKYEFISTLRSILLFCLYIWAFFQSLRIIGSIF